MGAMGASAPTAKKTRGLCFRPHVRLKTEIKETAKNKHDLT